MQRLTSQKIWAISICLVLCMGLTRGTHFASLNALPDASLALFFIAGALALPRWIFPLFVLEAILLDFSSVSFSGVSRFCITPGYIMLLPAYGTLWFAGSVYHHKFAHKSFNILYFLICSALGISSYELLSSGSFYLMSGYFPSPSLAEFGERLAKYAPAQFNHAFLYLSVALGIGYLLNRVEISPLGRADLHEK